MENTEMTPAPNGVFFVEWFDHAVSESIAILNFVLGYFERLIENLRSGAQVLQSRKATKGEPIPPRLYSWENQFRRKKKCGNEKQGIMLLDTSYNKYLGTLPVKGLVWICMLTWMVSSSHAVDVNCCPKGSVWQPDSVNCSGGMKVQLSCPYGSYLVEPSVSGTDNFTLIHDDDETWLQFTELHELIPSSQFCIVDGENVSQAIVCFVGEYYNEHSSLWRETLFCVLGVISAVFLIATLAVYVLLPELREIQDKVMMAVVTALAVSYIVLSIQNLRPQEENDEAICVSLGFILYFSFMSAFFWLNVVAFNIWRTVWFRSCTIKERNLFTAYCIYGWGGPLCFLVVSLFTHHLKGDHLKPGFGERNCWFSGNEQMWAYFYGPIGILLTLNMIYLGLAGWRLWHQYCDYSGNKLRVLRFKCMLYIKLILAMGITWIFEVVSYAEGSKDNIWIPTDILNALQGLIIFLLLVATRKRVRKLLARKRPCGIAFPKSWAAYEDEECEDVLPEEIELSQHG